MDTNTIWSIIDSFLKGHDSASIHIFRPEDSEGYAIDAKGTRIDGTIVLADIVPATKFISARQVEDFINSMMHDRSIFPANGMVTYSPNGFRVLVSAFRSLGGTMADQAWVTYPHDAPFDELHREVLRVGAGTHKSVNTDVTTNEGLQAAFNIAQQEFPERASAEHEMTLNIAASDWQNGHEDRTIKMLTREYGYTLALRLIATLVATPGTPRGV